MRKFSYGFIFYQLLFYHKNAYGVKFFHGKFKKRKKGANFAFFFRFFSYFSSLASSWYSCSVFTFQTAVLSEEPALMAFTASIAVSIE